MIEETTATQADATPFAQATPGERGARRRMRRWVYGAGAQRLAHLGLIRPSEASRSFAFRQMAYVVIAASALQLATVGWHRVVRTPENLSIVQTTPQGRGWLRVAAAKVSPTETGVIAVWWNPLQSVVGLAMGLLAATLLVWILLLTLQVGAAKSERLMGERDSQRLRGAMHYGTAWTQGLLCAGGITLLLPACDVLATWRVGLAPPRAWVFVAATATAGAAVLAWWFWLVRLAITVRVSGRGRLTGYYGAVVPLIAAVLAVGWHEGLERLNAFAWPLFKLSW